jgi:hypothetical protein
MAGIPTELTQDVAIVNEGRDTGSKTFLQKFNALTRSVRDLLATRAANFGIAPHVIIEDQKTAGTDGGTFTAGAWQTRTLNTLVRNVGTLATLDTNQFTLPAGTYLIKGQAVAYRVISHQTRLRDITNSANVGIGVNQYSGTVVGDSDTQCSEVSGVVTVTGPTVFELQHQCGATKTTNGFGIAASFGTEVYARVEITQLA